MHIRKGKTKGDTLIEVTIAIGIFSMVAIAIIAIMNGGTSSAQTALETTLAREEIDTQAEALRFIQSAYIADMNSGEDSNGYTKLWQDIVKLAASGDTGTTSQISVPTACTELYEGDFFTNHAFIINPKQLNTSDPAPALVKADSDKLTSTTTYPRLVFNQAEANNTSSLASNSTSSNLYRAEGIYVIAVKDDNSTNISGSGKTSAFYDFYIRTCWYGNGEEIPSYISTVIRLYDPDAIAD